MLITETGYFRYNFRKHREQFDFTIEKDEFDNPENPRIDIKRTRVDKKYNDKYFHASECVFEYDIKLERKTSVEVFSFTRSNDFKLFSSHFDRLI